MASPVILASWHSQSSLIPTYWGWDQFINSLLRKKKWQKWWAINPRIRLQKILDSILEVLSHSWMFSPCQVPYHEAVLMSRDTKSRDIWMVRNVDCPQACAWAWNPVRTTGRSLLDCNCMRASELEAPTKLCLNSWPRKCEIIHVYHFQLLKFGVICHVAINNQYRKNIYRNDGPKFSRCGKNWNLQELHQLQAQKQWGKS